MSPWVPPPRSPRPETMFTVACESRLYMLVPIRLLSPVLGCLRQELIRQQNSSSLSETIPAEVASLRGRLQESTSRTLESQKDFDCQWLQGVVQQSSYDAKSSLQRDLTKITCYIEVQTQRPRSAEGADAVHQPGHLSRNEADRFHLATACLSLIRDPKSIVVGISNIPTLTSHSALASQFRRAVRLEISQLIALALENVGPLSGIPETRRQSVNLMSPLFVMIASTREVAWSGRSLCRSVRRCRRG